MHSQLTCLVVVQAFEWLQAMLRISLAPALPAGKALPQILCYDELETMDTMMWLGMQNVILVNDRCSPGFAFCILHLHFSAHGLLTGGTESSQGFPADSSNLLCLPWIAWAIVITCK